VIVWDNTFVMHRAAPGGFEGKAKRDLRRTTAHDASSTAWGLNNVGSTWRAGLP
jgi:alpha-ketoglutarate-dependent 2,4-dichlorophenoxyacetate dioxygenase